MARPRRLLKPVRLTMDIEEIDNLYLEMIARERWTDKAVVIRKALRPIIQSWLAKKTPEQVKELQVKLENVQPKTIGRPKAVILP